MSHMLVLLHLLAVATSRQWGKYNEIDLDTSLIEPSSVYVFFSVNKNMERKPWKYKEGTCFKDDLSPLWKTGQALWPCGRESASRIDSQNTIYAKVLRLHCNCPISSCVQKGFSSIYSYPAGQKSKAFCPLWICSSNSLGLISSPPTQFSESLPPLLPHCHLSKL